MEVPKFCFLQASLFFFLLIVGSAQKSPAGIFGEYIGAEFKNVKFSDVPINPKVQFHFILSFAIDYDSSSSPSPTNGKFNVFWDSQNLSPAQVSSIKTQHSNVKDFEGQWPLPLLCNLYVIFRKEMVRPYLLRLLQ